MRRADDDDIGLRPERLQLEWISAAEGILFAETMKKMEQLRKGVTAEARAKIFEPYVTTKATGTGLGLAIAKKIALEHGGTLDVAEAPAPTGGARFVLTIPLAG